MAQYNIEVKINPGAVQDGSRVIRTEFQNIRTEAAGTQAAIDRAFSETDVNINMAPAVKSIEEMGTAARRVGATIESSFSLSSRQADGLAAAIERANATIYGNGAAFNRLEAAAASAASAVAKETAAENAAAAASKKHNETLDESTKATRRSQQATLNAGQQMQDFTTQVLSGANPITAFTQQAGQMAFAMANMEGKLGSVGRFLGGPWGTVLLIATSVLGQFVYQMLNTEDATNEASDALEGFARKQQEVANFVDTATGAVIQQSRALRDLAIAKREADLEAQRSEANNARRDAFNKARRVADPVAQDPYGLVAANPGDPRVQRVITASNGDVGKLEQGIRRLGPAYKTLADQVAIAGEKSITFDQTLKQQNAEIEALRGNTAPYMNTLAEYRLQQVRIANATSDRERAQLRLNQAEQSYRNIQNKTPDSPQARAALADVERATKAVNAAKDAEDALRKARSASSKEHTAALQAERQAQRYAETFRLLEAEGDLGDVYGRQLEIRKAQLGIERSLHRELTPDEKSRVTTIVDTNAARRAEGDVLRQLRQPIEDYATQLRALDDLLEKGKITQGEYDAQLAQSPLVQGLRQVDQSLLGTSFAAESQLDSITLAINRAIAAIDAAEKAGIIGAGEAARRRAAVRGPDATSDPNAITVTGRRPGDPETLKERLTRENNDKRRDQLNSLDQRIGGKIGQDAERDQSRTQYENDLRELQQFYGEKYSMNADYLRREAALKKRFRDQDIEFERAKKAVVLTQASDTFGNLAEIMKAAAGEQSAIYKAMFAASKAFAIAESIVNIQAAIAKAANLPFPENLPAIATVIAQTASIVSNIQAVALAFADGGYVYGPGGPRDDNILARLSAGEMVMNAPATARNRPVLEAMNNGRDPQPTIQPTLIGGGAPLNVQFGDINVSYQSSGDAGQDAAALAAETKKQLRDAVRDVMATEMRAGGMLTRTRESVMR